MKEWHEDKRDRPATEGETLHTALKKAASVLEKKYPHPVKQDLI
jgi:hypothetical protein